MNLPGLPTAVVVDTKAKTVNLTGYQPPAAPLQAYVRLNGLIDDLPDARALATLSGLPSPLDLTVGPVETKGSTMDFKYSASAPLGTLQVDADVTTTNAQFPVLRGRASVAKLPATMHLSGQFGEHTIVGVHNSAPVDRIAVTVTSATQGHLQASVEGVPATADIDVDLAAKHASADMSGPIGAITALAHVPYEGRTWSVFAQITGIPGKFEADFGGGAFAFRGLSGPLGSASLAVTNHGGATALAGPHVAVHYNEVTQDIDASASIGSLTSVEYRTEEKKKQHFALNMGAMEIGIDAGITLAPDTRLAVTGKLTTPNTITVELAEGAIVYDADRPTSLLLEVRAGKVGALEGLGAPLYGNGVAARARACDTTKPGCAQDDGPACKLLGKCFGAVAIVNLPGLPKKVVVGFETKTVEVRGMVNPGNELKLFVELVGLIPKAPKAAGLVALTGMPSPLDLTAGPFHFQDGDPTLMDVRYSANGPIGTLVAQLQSTVEGVGDLSSVRGRFELGTIPAQLKVTGRFGETSEVKLDSSAPIGRLFAKVTAKAEGNLRGEASGLVEVTDVPAHVGLKISGFEKEGAGLPTINYTGRTGAEGAFVSTLDGEVKVEADLIYFIPEEQPLRVAGDVFAGFTDLGGDTTIVLRPDKSIGIESKPAGTANLRLGASINTDIPRQDVDLDLFSTSWSGIPLKGKLTGHFEVPEIMLDDLMLTIDGIRTMDLVPGKNFISTGVRGDYDTLAIDIGDLEVDLDVFLKFDFTAAGASVFDESVIIKERYDAIRFHKSDMKLRRSGTFDLGVTCLDIWTNPGNTARVENRIELFGRDGQQVLNYIDPVPTPVGLNTKLWATALDLVTVYYSSPFTEPAPEAAYLPIGPCSTE